MRMNVVGGAGDGSQGCAARPRTIPTREQGDRLAQRWAQGTAMVLFTINIASGAVRRLHTSHDWLDHLQVFARRIRANHVCYEGPGTSSIVCG